MVKPLLGAGHRKIVVDLEERLAALQRGADVPRVVVLTGASGTGKSAIVRELYRRLAGRQPQPGYWPELSGGAEPGARGNVLADRKVLGPAEEGFEWPVGSLPAFTWWVFDGQRRRGRDLLDVVSQARPAIEAHLVPALLAWRRTKAVRGQLGSLHDEVETRVRRCFDARSDVLDMALDAGTRGSDLLFDWSSNFGRVLRSDQHHQPDAVRAPGADPGSGRAAEQTARLILSAVNAEIAGDCRDRGRSPHGVRFRPVS